ncbi:STAS domain-containing protein [Devosia sp. FKR38]|uniref:STAS domain-containing protein n=1 Tax=Devosia sp. FKR38 TaxID=2562312 RepID=UPI0010BF76A5|nr:STAS domain-containing protein [Devosia sp. FKR38]
MTEKLWGLSFVMVKQAGKSVALPAIVDLDSLEGVRDVLVDALDEGAVTISANAVERVSTNALFMLISAAETARRNRFDFAIEQPSPAFAAAIERLGLDAQFSGMMRG